MPETITVAGSLAQRHGHGGHAWVFLQYLLGFRALGFDVVFVDRLEPGMCVDGAGRQAPFRDSENVRYLADVMARAGLDGCWSALHAGGPETAGLSRVEVVDRVRRSALLLNVMGYLDDDEILAAAPLRVFLDIDPGFGHLWRALGLHDAFVGHHRYVTVGTGIGREGCAVPTGGIDWITTLPPVALDHWPAVAAPPGPCRFTTVASWRGPFGPIEFAGRSYGLRVHEFRRFVELPSRVDATFELALDIDAADADDRRRLVAEHWQLTDPRAVAGDPWDYKRYIVGSSAEFMVAKNLYVDTGSGWFSDRSACYLATGRPVLAQDTRLPALLPTDEGIVAFSTLDEASAGAKEIVGDYERHARAASDIAREHLAAERVLARLLASLGIST